MSTAKPYLSPRKKDIKETSFHCKDFFLYIVENFFSNEGANNKRKNKDPKR